MKTREEAKALAIDLALQRKSVRTIAKRLEKEGMDGLLTDEEIRLIVEKVDVARRELQRGKGHIVLLAIGMVALMVGLFLLLMLGMGSIFTISVTVLGVLFITFSLMVD